MSRYLLAAEADKIQDLLFRSSRLREVVGGSQLLTRFCREVPRHLLSGTDAEIIISNGGSFRILFNNEQEAHLFREQLAEVYRRATGGSLTVAKPILVNDNFAKASDDAENALRQAKRDQRGWQTSAHVPYVAFCASCGIGLAVKRYSPYGEETQYLCPSCIHKSEERKTFEEQVFENAPSASCDQKEENSFLGIFFQAVIDSRNLKEFDWPGKEYRKDRRGEKDPIEDIADYDPRRYVAYIVADGNEMGKVFGACKTPEQMRTLSTNLARVIRTALAEPSRMIMGLFGEGDRRSHFIPTLPLILGGDDVFVLVPAPWALDFARRFAMAYEREMRKLLNEIGLGNVIEPTVSVAVVICKSKYPYHLAHQLGERRLQEAKRLTKRLAQEGTYRSTIHFEVVLGRQLASPEAEPRKLQPTLRPYWVNGEGIPEGWGVSIQHLIDQRYRLRSVPHKRLAELQELFDETTLPNAINDPAYGKWQKRLSQLLERMERRGAVRAEIEAALRSLGDPSSDFPHWYFVDRRDEGESPWRGHALPDLLAVWDFALDLSKPRKDYEEGLI